MATSDEALEKKACTRLQKFWRRVKLSRPKRAPCRAILPQSISFFFPRCARMAAAVFVWTQKTDRAAGIEMDMYRRCEYPQRRDQATGLNRVLSVW